MRKFKCLLLLAFIGLTTSVFGQSIWTTVNTEGYNRIYASYLPSKLKVDGFDAEDLGLGDGDLTKMKGSFEIGYLRGIGLTSQIPLYLEVGGALQFRSSKWSENDSYSEGFFSNEIKANMLSLNIPVSLAYRISINDDFAISPNFGFDFHINLTGKLKAAYSESYNGEFYEEEAEVDLFKDGSYEDYEIEWEGWKRFQAGWHIGVGFDYRALHVGVKYGTDFNEITEKTKIATTSVTLGFNF